MTAYRKVRETRIWPTAVGVSTVKLNRWGAWMGQRQYLEPGDTALIRIGWSEVCMHMRVAGKLMRVRVTDGRYPAAQLLRADGSEFSAPIGLGEAGLYRDQAGIYGYVLPLRRGRVIRRTDRREGRIAA